MRTNDFLLVQDLLCRPPLQSWARSIQEGLESEIGPGRQNSTHIASLLNLAAFVEILRGDKNAAKAICEAELAWVASLASKTAGSLTISALAIQPWINIGRLLRIDGRCQEALSHFDLVLKRPDREPLLLGPCRIQESEWEDLLASDVSLNLWNVYLVDSLKTYFRCRRFDVALRFIAELREVEPRCHDNLLLEGQIISQIGLGDYERSYQLAKSRSDQDVLDTVVLMLYQAQCLTELDRHDDVLTLTRDLKTFALLGGLDALSPSIAMRCLEKLGAVLERIEQKVQAAQVYVYAYRLAVTVNDQPHEISFLRALARQVRCEEKQKLEDMRLPLLKDCYYNDVLQSEGLSGQRWCEAFGDLRSAVSMVTRGVAATQPDSRPFGVGVH